MEMDDPLTGKSHRLETLQSLAPLRIVGGIGQLGLYDTTRHDEGFLECVEYLGRTQDLMCLVLVLRYRLRSS